MNTSTRTYSYARTGERDNGDAEQSEEDGEEAGVLGVGQNVPEAHALVQLVSVSVSVLVTSELLVHVSSSMQDVS